ncbi:hypothetical protein B9Z55_028485 [Caenorhabditis nigoni]|uniref:Uncharacterized protein n=1 Tax=Caenorhabditis nigoni TaxID=1611254 RepID=A0A2G5SB91_9PELO|nr:hypothetical protein B9Z55_028485 [Caenorhabditis nigoni]
MLGRNRKTLLKDAILRATAHTAPTPFVNPTQRDGTSPNSIDDTIDRITRGDDTRVGQSSTRKIPRRNQSGWTKLEKNWEMFSRPFYQWILKDIKLELFPK